MLGDICGRETNRVTLWFVSDENLHPGRRSISAEGAAARWSELHPEHDIEHPPPSEVPEDEQIVPNRHSAAAEAASLRWHEMHENEDF
jgi:hypothetical protein